MNSQREATSNQYIYLLTLRDVKRDANHQTRSRTRV